MSLIIMVCGRHRCGHHGHCLWPSWFVAIIVEPLNYGRPAAPAMLDTTQAVIKVYDVLMMFMM